MGANSFNEMEIDALGEIMNISLGSSATAVSTMLGTKVDITTPKVKVQTREEFEFKRLEPAIGVEIAYVEGLDGRNVMIFRREDVQVIVGMLMGEDLTGVEVELSEIHISAICEIMNQMMGASATALSEFLGMVVNISTPVSFPVGEPEDFKDKYFTEAEGMVVVRFRLEIEDRLNSEFMNIMPIRLAKRLLLPFGLGGDDEEEAKPEEVKPEESAEAPAADTGSSQMSQEELDAMMASMQGGAPAETPAADAGSGQMSQAELDAMLSSMQGGAPTPAETPAADTGSGQMSQAEMDAMMASMQSASTAGSADQPEPTPAQPMSAAPVQQTAAASAQQPYYPPYPAMDPVMLQLLSQMQQTQMQMIEMMKQPAPKAPEPANLSSSIIRPLSSDQLSDTGQEGTEEKTNQEMLLKVPLEVSVEIGRTKRLVRDILEFTQGTLVVLDKMAGEQVDLFVNGQCIARGDIVVVEDNFGIRITEIVSKEVLAETL